MNQWIVMASSAKPPRARSTGQRMGIYKHVAVVKLTIDYAEKGLLPKMISERAEGVIEVRPIPGVHHVGKTSRSGYHRALAEARELAEKLNKESGL
jgi:hypothetical protein